MIVTTDMTNGVAVLTVNNPPVNMGNTALRRALAESLDEVATRDDVVGVVIASAASHFYAGSDISEFDRPLQAPQLPEVIARIENLDVPVVAALTGLTLGGGLELALGCDLRIGDPTTVVGFPETTLGILPGAGGTVRTARLVGVAPTIDLVASARRIDADEALALGLIDEVVPADLLLARAAERAATLTAKKRLIDLPAPPSDPATEEAARARRSKRARPNVLAAIDMVCAGVSLDGREALRRERALFDQLRMTDEAANLRYLFFAKRRAAKATRPQIPAPAITTIGIAGAGTMGAALARAFAEHGYEVIVFDSNRAALDRLADGHGISGTESIADLGRADVTIDAVFEDMDVKTTLLRELEPHLRDTAVIASNTSYLDLHEMASVLAIPERFVGLHFFNPPDRNPLVEIIRTSATDERTLAVVSSLASRLGKAPIPAGIGDGFVANRIYADYRMQAEFLVEDGASPAEVDTALVELGFAIGPFAVADMSGLDIAWARRKRLAATRDPRQRYVDIADRLCEAGRLGKKTGAGWYHYPDGARRGVVDPRVDEIIDKARADAGMSARAVSGDEIRDRVLASMVCAAAALVADGIAERASDIDVALTEGFAFPAHLGGPVRAFARRNRDEVVAALAAAYRSCPISFAVAEPAVAGKIPEAIEKILEAVR